MKYLLLQNSFKNIVFNMLCIVNNTIENRYFMYVGFEQVNKY